MPEYIVWIKMTFHQLEHVKIRCELWESACEIVKEFLPHSPQKAGQVLTVPWAIESYNKWVVGQISKIEDKEIGLEIFVTGGPWDIVKL